MAIVQQWNFNGNTNAQIGLNLIGNSLTYNTGINGQAAVFNGSTSTASYLTATTLGISNSFTISQWIYPTKNSGQCFELRNYNTNVQNLVQTYLNTDTTPKMIYGIYNSSGTEFKNYTSGITFPLNNWYQVIHTWDGTNMKLYVNGVLDSTPTKNIDNTGTMTDSTRKIYIGSNVEVNTFFGGKIDTTYLDNLSYSYSKIKNIYLFNKGFF